MYYNNNDFPGTAAGPWPPRQNSMVFICGRELVTCRIIISKLKKDSQLLSVLSTILGEEITPTASMNICEQCDSKDAK